MGKTAERKKISTPLKSELLEKLTYEMVDGKPIYYRNYERVLKGELPPEAVMGSSELQALIIGLLLKYLYKVLPNDYVVLTNELGFYTSPKSYRSLDIAVYRKEDMKKPSTGYAKKPPKVVIEVDTKADLRNYATFEEYMFEKTQELLDAGVEAVAWYITRVKKVFFAERGKDWVASDWDKTVKLPIGVEINLAKLLEEEGIKP
ncbi:MAG TPA: Uma2 family endonuclease [Aquifex sp.]|nr:Uma2 family endonuclease [Aquifex sp.]